MSDIRDRHEIIVDLVDERKANYDLRAENERLRERNEKLKAALLACKRYAEDHDDEWVPFTVDAALKDAPGKARSAAAGKSALSICVRRRPRRHAL